MANYLYNGVELPDINEVWNKVNKEHWRYASIFMSSSARASLYFTQGPCRISSGNSELVDIPGGYHYSYWNGGTWSDPTSYDDPFTSDNAKYAVWANFDILNTDGSVYLAASDPVPVGGEPTTRTEWQKQDAYKPNTEWDGKTFYRVMGGKWVKQDVVVPQVVEVEPDVPEPDVPDPDVPEPDVPYPDDCLTFASAKPFTLRVSTTEKIWDGTMYYSTDMETWSEWDGVTTISSAEHYGEQRVYVRGKGNSFITGFTTASGKYVWRLSGSKISCNGNIENLLDYEIVKNGEHPVMAGHCYHQMFENCASLTRAPDLPATTLATSCYSSMFKGCTSLTSAPELPATTLATSCYSLMFQGCTSLTRAPDLPATTLTDHCYYWMFRKCTSLTRAPELPATTLTLRCYYHMFQGCTSLTSAPELPATTLSEECYDYMFYGCTSLTQAPELPATTLAKACYFYMFYGCTSLTQAPELPATTLAQNCYYAMFRDCTALTQAPELPATTLAQNCYYAMFNGCTEIKLSEMQIGEYQTPYRIPTSGTGTTATDALTDMFTGTGGTFTGTPSINTTYYTANEVV